MILQNTLPTDVRYLGEISSRLEGFEGKGNHLWVCRCPICGDSQKNKFKKRGYFFNHKYRLTYKCHNCGASMVFSNFLKWFDTETHRKYIVELMKEGGYKKSRGAPVDASTSVADIFSDDYVDIFVHQPSLADLPEDHEARVYARERMIPARLYDSLYYVEHFKRFTNMVLPEEKFANTERDEPRIVFPIRNRDKHVVGFQGRAIRPSQLKYITISLVEDERMVWGVERIDPSKRVYIFEGVMDAMLVPNSVAMLSSTNMITADISPNQVKVYDNEARNAEVLRQMERSIKRGDAVVVWSSDNPFKDVNDMMVKGGLTTTEVLRIMEHNTYQGLKAMTAFMFWKKVPLNRSGGRNASKNKK